MNVKSADDNTGRPCPPSPKASSSHGAQLDLEEAVAEGGVAVEVRRDEEKNEPVTWRSLPHRRQLIILTLARLSEPLVQTSLQVSNTQFTILKCWGSGLMRNNSHICSTNSNPSTQPSPTLQ